MDSQRPIHSYQFRLRDLVLSIVAVGVVLAALILAIGAARETAHERRCKDNLRQIALAIQNYLDANGQFPSVYLSGADGKPAHSWRVLIAPYIDSRNYASYSFSEPWNGPNNSKLVGTMSMPVVFRCPTAGGSDIKSSSYVAVVGPQTMWRPNGYVRMSDIVDGTGKTIMVVEISNSDIHWMEPRDLPIEELEQWLDPAHQPTLLNSHTKNRIRGGLAVFADGHTEFLPQDIAIERLESLLGITEGPYRSGNEPK